MTLKQALWEIVRDENIIITNQNIDWLLERASKKAFGNTDILKQSILERKEKLDKLGEPENKSNEELFKKALVEGVNRHIDKTIEQAKQIEEMFFDVVKAFNYARDFCTEQGGCDICENRKYGKNCDFASMTEHLYNAGYRKQSEGEWVKINPNNLLIGEYYCSYCNSVIDIADGRETPLDREMYYCPNCGARMRGE